MCQLYGDGSRERVTISLTHAVICKKKQDRSQALATSERVCKRGKERRLTSLMQLSVQGGIHLTAVEVNFS
jgi:hypothetical protein